MYDIWRVTQFFLKLQVPAYSFYHVLVDYPRHFNDCWDYATLQKEHSMRLSAYEKN